MLSNSSSSTTSRVAKTSCSSSSSSQRVHHVTSSEMKASSMKSDLSELKSSISEMKNLSSSHAMNFNRLRSSVEDLVDMDDGGGGGGNGEPLVTFPDTPDSPTPASGSVLLPSSNGNALTSAASASSSTTTSETMKFEQKRMKVVTDQFSSEQAVANSAEMKSFQAGDVSYQEQSAAQAVRARLDMDGISAEKSLNMKQVSRTLKSLVL